MPKRNTTRAGTSRLRYAPAGSSTVSRSFHAVTLPKTTSPSPPIASGSEVMRVGTATGTPRTMRLAAATIAVSHAGHCRARAVAAMAPPTAAAAMTRMRKATER